jgi:hypothetical protein
MCDIHLFEERRTFADLSSVTSYDQGFASSAGCVRRPLRHVADDGRAIACWTDVSFCEDQA